MEDTSCYFEKYLEHYSQIANWFQHHQLITNHIHINNKSYINPRPLTYNNAFNNLGCCYENKIPDKDESRFLASSLNKLPKSNFIKNNPKSKSKKNKSKKHKNKKFSGDNSLQLSDINSKDEDIESHNSDNSDDVEMEITEDMIKFFTQSAQHRRDRDKNKSDTNFVADGNDFYNEHSKITGNKSSKAIEKPGEKRLFEMKELYGKGSSMIHGMETAMQLTFDRNLDQKQPKLWPAIPLNIKFY